MRGVAGMQHWLLNAVNRSSTTMMRNVGNRKFIWMRNNCWHHDRLNYHQSLTSSLNANCRNRETQTKTKHFRFGCSGEYREEKSNSSVGQFSVFHTYFTLDFCHREILAPVIRHFQCLDINKAANEEIHCGHVQGARKARGARCAYIRFVAFIGRSSDGMQLTLKIL